MTAPVPRPINPFPNRNPTPAAPSFVAERLSNFYLLKKLSNASDMTNCFFHRYSLVICSNRSRQRDDAVFDGDLNTR